MRTDGFKELPSGASTGFDVGDYMAKVRVNSERGGESYQELELKLGYTNEASDETYLGTFSVVLDLGSVETARRIGEDPEDLRSKLSRIALELQSISLAAQMPSVARVPLEHPDLASLSAREKEVLTHLVAGKRVPAIAEDLFISPHTVRNHLKNIYSKLYVNSQSQLIELVRNLENP